MHTEQNRLGFGIAIAALLVGATLSAAAVIAVVAFIVKHVNPWLLIATTLVLPCLCHWTLPPAARREIAWRKRQA